jgi:hypothetical protein
MLSYKPNTIIDSDGLASMATMAVDALYFLCDISGNAHTAPKLLVKSIRIPYWFVTALCTCLYLCRSGVDASAAEHGTGSVEEYMARRTKLTPHIQQKNCK